MKTWLASRLCRAVIFLLPIAAAFVFTAGGIAFGQATPSPDQLRVLQEMQQRQGAASAPQPAVPSEVVLQPTQSQQGADSARSRLEQIMSVRAGTQLKQFGYDLLGSGRPVTVPQTGAVEEDYILGPNDEVIVTLRGQENNEYRAIVDRNGQIVLPRLNPISAAGRSFTSLRQDVDAAVHRAYVATSAFVSLGRLRQVSVLVSGEVNVPGQRLVTGLSTVADALLLSGGVRKTGSLRTIHLRRGGHDYVVDLYSILTNRGGAAARMLLTDGDQILVSPLGRTVAVTGLVRQPGIYELPPGQASISTRALLALAGGLEVRGKYRLSVLRIQPDGRSSLQSTTEAATVQDSEILFADIGADDITNQATLAGGSGLAGRYAIVTGTRLSELLKAPGALGPAPYTLFGIVSRRDSRTLLRTLSAITPVAVLSGNEDVVLQADDIVRVLSVNEIHILTEAVTKYQSDEKSRQEAIRNPVAAATGNPTGPSNNRSTGGSPSPATGAAAPPSLSAIRDAASTPISSAAQQDSAELAAQERFQVRQAPATDVAALSQNLQQPALAAGQIASNQEVNSLNDLAQQLGVSSLVLINFMLDHDVTLQGAVRGPGDYFVGPSAPLLDLVQAAGGTVNWADESGVELITTAVSSQTGKSTTQRVVLPLRQGQLASYVVKARDQLRFNTVFTDTQVGQVTVQGEFRYTGTYDLLRGEHLSDLIARAGGLTNSAYPYGTVFLRKSVAARERDGFDRAATEVSEQLVVAMTRVGNNKIDPAAFAALQGFVTELRTQPALGRISVAADPSILASNPQQDPLLEAGDVIYVPQRPDTITVLGRVMQQGTYPFRSGATIQDYIEQAGGYAQFANESDTYVVLPDGSARKVERSWLKFTADNLPPGSAIVIPRDVTPLDLRQTIIDVSQIFSQFAVAIASVAVLSKQ